MDEVLLQQYRLLDDQLFNIRSLISEVAEMLDTSYDLQMSMAALFSPDVMNGVREAEAIVKEAEAELSSCCNNISNETAEVKFERTESVGEGTSVTLSPDCTVEIQI